MDMYYVSKRKKELTDKVYIDAPKNVLYESCVRNTTMESLEKYINSFDYTMDNQEGVLKLTMLLEYVFDKNSNINKNRILKSIASNVVPKVTNLKGLLESLTDICNKNEIDATYISEECKKYIDADRIIANDIRLNNRFKLDSFIKEYVTLDEDDERYLISELCFKIDTYNIDIEKKFAIALESIEYSLYKNNKAISSDLIIEEVIDYFSMMNCDIDAVLEKTNMKQKVKSIYNKAKEKVKGKAQEILLNLRQKDIYSPGPINTAIRKIYMQSPEQIIDDVPHIFTYFRNLAILTTFAFNPIVGCVIKCADLFISMSVKRNEIEIFLYKYIQEKKTIEKKLEKCKNDKQRENLKAYLSGLNKSIDKLETYKRNLYSERELEDMNNNENSVYESNNYLRNMMNYGIHNRSLGTTNKSPIIYKCTKDDFEDIIFLNRNMSEYDAKYVNSINTSELEKDIDKYFIMRLKGAPIGYCKFTHDNICSIYVTDQFKSQGYGSKMLEYVINNSDSDFVYFDIIANNDAANALARHCGFKRVEAPKDENSDFMIARWQKELDNRSLGLDEIPQKEKDECDNLNACSETYIPYTVSEEYYFSNLHNRNKNEMKCINKAISNYSFPLVLKEHFTSNNISLDMLNKENIANFLTESGRLFIHIGSWKGDDKKLDRFISTLSEATNTLKIVSESYDDETNIFAVSKYDIKTNVSPVHNFIKNTAIQLEEMAEAMSSVSDNSNSIIEETMDNISKYDRNYLTDVATVLAMAGVVEEAKDAFIDDKDYAYSIKDNLRVYEDCKSINILESFSDDIDLFKVSECINCLGKINEYINEGAIDNIKLSLERLKKSVLKLKDKEKEWSKSIDAKAEKTRQDVTHAFVNRNREAVIKGSIIPNASTCIKLGIAAAGAGMINPALSAIGILGYLGISKMATAKERKYILSEIEVELRLVEKKIQLAERNDDTKALGELYRIEKRLKNEQARIKYHMKDFRPVYTRL